MLKTISIPDREVEVMAHFDSQPNKSQYIVNLIKADLEGRVMSLASSGIITDEQIEVAVLKALMKYDAIK